MKVFLESVEFNGGNISITIINENENSNAKHSLQVFNTYFSIFVKPWKDFDFDFCDACLKQLLYKNGMENDGVNGVNYLMNLITISRIERVKFVGFTNKKKNLLIKIESKNYYALYRLNKILNEETIRTYHSNWSPVNQFLHQSRVHIQSHFNMNYTNLHLTRGVDIKCLHYDDKFAHDVMPIHSSVTLKIVAISKDALHKNEAVSYLADSSNKLDRIILIGLRTMEKTEIFTLLPLQSSMVGNCVEVSNFLNENIMIDTMSKRIIELDPSYVLYYEDDFDDIEYISKRLGSEFKYKIARVKSEHSKKNIISRTFINLKNVIRRSAWFNLSSYKLRQIIKSSKILNPPKSDQDQCTKITNINKVFLQGVDGWLSILNMLVDDIENISNIEKNLSVITEFRNISKVSDTNVEETINRGEQIRVYNKLTRECTVRGYYINDESLSHNCKLPISDKVDMNIVDPGEHDLNVNLRLKCSRDLGKFVDNKSEILEGGNVMKPTPKYWKEEQIGVLDFKSLYPSIMIAYNISYETIIMNQEYAKESGIDYITVQINSKEYIMIAQVKNAIVPSILTDLISERDKIKIRMKKESDPFKLSVLDKAQNSMKILCNATYGFCGAAGKFAILPMRSIMYTVTAIGRYLQKKCAFVLASKYNVYTLYGDTDSIFVWFEIKRSKINTIINELESKFDLRLDHLRVSISNILDNKVAYRMLYCELYKFFCVWLSNMFPDPILLEFENLADRLWLSDSKKYYCYRKWDPDNMVEASGVKVIGMASKKREYNRWTRTILTDVTNMIILNNANEEDILFYLRKHLQQLVEYGVNKSKLVLSKEYLGKHEYKNDKQPHVQVVKKMEYRLRTEIKSKCRISYIIKRGDEIMYKRAEEPEFVLSVEVDLKYNLRNQLYKPLKKLLMFHDINVTSLIEEYCAIIFRKHTYNKNFDTPLCKVKKMTFSQLIRRKSLKIKKLK